MKRLCDHKFMGKLARGIALFCMGVAMFATSAHAQSASKSSGGNTGKEAFLSAGFLGLSKSSTQYDLAPGFNFKPLVGWNWLQIGGELTYQKISFRGGSASNVVFSGGPTVNFGDTTGDASFISLGLLYKSGSASYEDPADVDPNGLGFYLMAGKRFPLSTSISLRPSIGIESAGSTALVFRPLAMSFFF